MRGRSPNYIPGACFLFGPIERKGLVRLLQMGSVRILIPSAWIRNVEWLTKVILIPPLTWSSGRLPLRWSIFSFQGFRLRLINHLNRSNPPLALTPPGLINLEPSKWSDTGPSYLGAEINIPMIREIVGIARIIISVKKIIEIRGIIKKESRWLLILRIL